MLLLLMRLTVVLIALTPCFSSVLSRNGPDIIELRPEISVQSQTILYGVPQRYRVEELQPTTVYDIKVSYPATQPSLFTLQVEHVLLPLVMSSSDNIEGNSAQTGQIMRPRRRILNTVKLRLYPKKMASHESIRYRLESSETALEVEFSLLAHVEGVQRPDSKLEMEKCVFDIVVEKVLVEAFPMNTLVLIGYVMALIAVCIKWVLPYLEKKIALACVEDRVEVTQTKEV